MLKTILNFLAGALIAAAVGAALAVTGTPPGTGPGLVDGAWLNGVAGGQNATFVSGITCTGTTQANAFQLTPGFTLIEIDAAAGGTGCNLPTAIPGVEISIFNNTANNALNIYPTVPNNPATGAQDTINNTTSVQITSRAAKYFWSAKTGNWAAE
jgi:hypothetical protein